MSYCRFSSDNWKSDIYCYEHCYGGFITHVAGNRRAFPAIPDIPLGWVPRFGAVWSKSDLKVAYPSKWHHHASKFCLDIWCIWHSLHMWSVGIVPLKPIGLPHDGESFSDETPDECADRMESLRLMGYHVPQHAIDRLREEAMEPAP